MDSISTLNALKAVQAGLSQAAPSATQTVMLYNADGTPAGKYPAQQLVQDLVQPPTYTLEETTNPAFTVTGSAALESYLAHSGGYMLLVKDSGVYAAKLKATDWNYFADGTAVDDASKYETMVFLPTAHFHAHDTTMVFGGEVAVGNGHTFDSPNWVGAYEMYVDADGKGHSRPDVTPAHSKTMSAFWSCAQALGTDFGLANYGFHCLINALFQAKYGNLNSQSVVGSGGQISDWESWRDVAMGYGRSLGDGSGTAATSMSGQNCVKLFGFEDLWSKLWEFRPGIRFYYDSTASKRYAVVYEGNVVSNTATGRTFEIPLLNAGGGYVTKMKLGEYWDMIPKAVGGSAATGYCDGYWDASGGQLLLVGGCASDGSRSGLSFAYSYYGFSSAGAHSGSRLAFYGTPELVTGTELMAM